MASNSENEAENDIRGLCGDRKGKLWAGTKDGRLHVTDSVGHKFDQIFANARNDELGQIYTIFQDHSGVMWLGTKADGLYRATPLNSSETSYHLDHYRQDPNDPYSISSDEIYSIAEDKKNQIWIGSFENGLNMAGFYGGKLRFYNHKNSLRNYPAGFQKIRNVGVDEKNRLWIGTTNGLVIMQEGRQSTKGYSFVTYAKRPGDDKSLGNTDVQYVFCNRDGKIWIGTSGGGVNVTDSKGDVNALRFETISTASGLPNDYVLSIKADDFNNIWIATQKGVSRYTPSVKKLTNYDSNDGLPLVRLEEASITRMRDGDIVIGTFRGYIRFNPSKVIDHPIYSRLVFTGLEVNNHDINSKIIDLSADSNANYINSLHLKHDENVLKIGFSVLDYRSSDKQNYEYRLKNLDTGWKSSVDQRSATYTNLSPGKYIFEVKCSDPKLYSNTPYKRLDIIISPPFWKTWWAYVLYVIAVALLLEFARRTILTMLRLRQRIAVEEKLADLKMKFFTNVSHELRTPLTLILNPIEEISESEKLSDKGRQHIQIVLRNAQRMVTFINQLLDLRKVQTGKAVLRLSNLDIIYFAKRVLSYFDANAAAKNVTIKLESGEAELFAFVDAEKFDIILFNIIANAIKFTPNGKCVTIKIVAHKESNTADIQVIDEGAGVPENQLENIFELYYEGVQEYDSKIKGTGIGLALAKELVSLHHGNITATNLKSGGFSVNLVIPLGREHFKENEYEMADDHHARELTLINSSEHSILIKTVSGNDQDLPRLLLVEDNAELRAFLVNQLSGKYYVETAGNGKEGLEKTELFAPDLIISDVMMPEMDGIQMLNKLKSDPGTSHIPVILLTARSAIEHQIEGLKYGADLYITKPFNNVFLATALENLLRKRSALFENMTNKLKVKLDPSEIIITSRDEIFLKEMIKIVETGMIDADFTIDKVADLLGMGRTTLYNKFKSLTNLSPIEFIKDMRMKRGIQYLDGGETNISTIAYSIGFNNAKYFSTCFKEKYHITPSEYIKSRKKVENVKITTGE